MKRFLPVVVLLIFLTSAASADKIHIFVKGGDKALWTKVWDGSQWVEWATLGGILSASPDACYRGAGIFTVFTRVQGIQEYYPLFYRTFFGGQWVPWESMGFEAYSSPTCAANHDGDQIDVFYQGQDDGLNYSVWKNNAWQNTTAIPGDTDSSWLEDLFGGEKFAAPTIIVGQSPWGGKLIGGPDACSWGGKRLDVFVRGKDNHLWHVYVDDNGNRQAWEDLGGNLTSDPSCVSRGSGLIDVVARGGDNALWIKSYVKPASPIKGAGWSEWTSWGGNLTSAADACSWGGKRLDVFARGGNGEVWHKWRNEQGGMSEWESGGGKVYFNSDPSCIAYK
jgi:hypothetical protein